jgi:flagellar basal body rod protein FlgB
LQVDQIDVVSALTSQLNFLTARHKIHSHNIANAGTAGFQALELMRSTDGADETGAARLLNQNYEMRAKAVDFRMDLELVAMQQNTGQYNLNVSVVDRFLQLRQLAISDSRSR